MIETYLFLTFVAAGLAHALKSVSLRPSICQHSEVPSSFNCVPPPPDSNRDPPPLPGRCSTVGLLGAELDGVWQISHAPNIAISGKPGIN